MGEPDADAEAESALPRPSDLDAAAAIAAAAAAEAVKGDERTPPLPPLPPVAAPPLLKREPLGGPEKDDETASSAAEVADADPAACDAADEGENESEPAEAADARTGEEKFTGKLTAAAAVQDAASRSEGSGCSAGSIKLCRDESSPMATSALEICSHLGRARARAKMKKARHFF